MSRAVTFVTDEKQATKLLFSGSTNRIVEGPGKFIDDSANAGVATLTNFSPGRITIQAEARGASAMLFVAQPYHSGWKATVNGAETGIQPADLAMMAIPLDAGPNTIKLFFDVPLAFWARHPIPQRSVDGISPT